MLQAHEYPDSFLAAPEAPVEATHDVPPSDYPGTVIGPYKLLEQIGEGGMGTVYMAEQTLPVQRKVALKIIKAGMDSKQVIARFEAERQALALMDHPNIAKVFDAGTTSGEPGCVSAGRPYFVMELVKGESITKYCNEHRLTPRQRLELFLPVCQAIQHAHQKGIIHRDIKASNVLIAPYDGKPVVKVIDFGIAKATGQRLTDKTLFTEFGAVVGTLEYMSPEQAELNNQDIDTRSDIYSLGVLLYELLTGTTPLDRTRLKQAAFAEMLRMIREVEPPKPSTRLSESKNSLPSISAQRQTEPAKLSKLVRGELDWIVMKALDKDRNRRYETANSFAADVQRYLDDEPVQACPPSASYRLRKFARRNKVALVTSGLVAAALLIGTAVSVWQAVEATDARELADKRLVLADDRLESEKHARANEERERTKAELAASEERKAKQVAEERRQQADAVAHLLESVFMNLNPDVAQRDRLDLRDRLIAQLDEAAEQLKGEATDPLTQARLQNAVGTAFLGVGEVDKAIIQAKRGLDKRQTILGPDHHDTLISMWNLALAYQDAGKLTLAVPLFEETLGRSKATLGTDHVDTLKSMHSLAVAYRHGGELGKSVPLFEETLKKRMATLRPNHADTLQTMNSLAVAF